MPAQAFAPPCDSEFSKGKQTASLIGHSQSRNENFNSQNTKPLVQPHQHSHLASWGICMILWRWGLKPANKQPSDVYTWSTTPSREAEENSFALSMRRIRSCRICFMVILSVFRWRVKYHRYRAKAKHLIETKTWHVARGIYFWSATKQAGLPAATTKQKPL